MSERRILNDQEMENVVGGFMVYNNQTMILTYTHEDGTVTTHPIYDYDNAWELSNTMHAKNYREDAILRKLQSKGYVG